jgi:hypothetical protein
MRVAQGFPKAAVKLLIKKPIPTTLAIGGKLL